MDTQLRRRDRAPVPFGTLVDRAFELYGARLPLYGAVALAILVLQGVVALASHDDGVAVFFANLTADALLYAVVTIGVAADRAGEERPNGAVLGEASLRWLLVLFVTIVANLVLEIVGAYVFNPLDTSPSGLAELPFLAVPLLLVWGPLACATVAAALSPAGTHPYAAFFKAIVQPFALGWSRGNLWRMVLLAIASLPVPMLQSVLLHQFGLHHVAYGDFLSQIPVDALTAGPYQALYTVFFLDLRARTPAPSRRTP